MDEILALIEIDFSVVFTGVIILLFAFLSILTLIEKISVIINKPVKWLRRRNEDHELLIQTAQGLTELRNTHEEDKVQSIRHDEMIREDLKSVVVMVNDISNKLVVMQEKDDAIEMAKLKEKILGYYRKYAPLGEWEKFEADVFWGLYENYINRGGNSFVRDDIEPVMRNLKVIN